MKTTDKKGKGESTENLDEKRKLALEIIEKLKQAYPDAAGGAVHRRARECRCGGFI